MRVAQIRVLGGAVDRVPADATAYAHRGNPIMLTIVAVCAGLEDRPVQRAWAAALAGRLDQGHEGAYAGFIGDDWAERVQQAWPGETWDRLQVLKARYDPTNLFHRNHNVPPAALLG
jgi:FAD/FMN-containing dehydrogenase